VIQLSQVSYSVLKERRTVLNFGELLDNVFGPPTAAVNASNANPDGNHISMLMEAVIGFELAAVPGCTEEFLQSDLDREPWDWTLAASPPYSYQLYHMWARLKALNWTREERSASLLPLTLSCSTSTAEPLACAYLLGINGATRCASLAAHAPLQYLCALELDNIIVSLSLASKRSTGGEGHKVLSQLFRAGVAMALCTEDPTFSQKVDDALSGEYCMARTTLGLREADLAEFARNSMAVHGSCAKPAQDDDVDAGDEANRTIRQRYRLSRRDAELKLISSMAQQCVERRGDQVHQVRPLTFTAGA
jgi:AMP deaminase